jgi:hypothetical protein
VSCYEGIRAVCDVHMIAEAETAEAADRTGSLMIAVGLFAVALFVIVLKEMFT